MVGENAVTFSGGQRQRLVLARRSCPQSTTVILDEATSALDTITQAKVSGAHRLQVTRVVVAHRLGTIRNADRVIVLDRGRVVQEGTFDGLVAVDGLFADLARRQVGMTAPTGDLLANYTPVRSEGIELEVVVEGDLPRGLAGIRAQRVKPSRGAGRRRMWHDGQGMVHAVRIEDGRATYDNRWVRRPRWTISCRRSDARRNRLPPVSSTWATATGCSRSATSGVRGGSIRRRSRPAAPTSSTPTG